MDEVHHGGQTVKKVEKFKYQRSVVQLSLRDVLQEIVKPELLSGLEC